MRRPWIHSTFVLTLVAVTASTWAEESVRPGQVTGVVDGDSLEVAFEDGRRYLDLENADCPELGQPFGDEARKMVLDLVLYQAVQVRIIDSRSNPWRVRIALSDGRDLGADLIALGLAWHTPRSTDSKLEAAERTARARQVGLWRQATPIPPWEWRPPAPTPPSTTGRARLLDAGSPSSSSCRPRSECCKVCSKGKACGNSCISRSYTCRKGRGCACNQHEIC